MVNLYHNVTVTSSVEQGISLGNTLDGWGNSLMKSSMANYGGKTYTVQVEKGSITESMENAPTRVSFWDKAKALVGLVLKRLAMLDGRIKTKYQLIGADEKTREGLLATLRNSGKEPKEVTKRGATQDIESVLQCCCCPCMAYDSINPSRSPWLH